MATAQHAAPLMFPGGQLADNNGNPLSGGKVFVYVAGTTTSDTSYPTYDDGLAGTNANANPVVLDANGRAQIWLQAGRLYKIVVKDSTEATTFQTVDDYNPAQGFPSPAVSEWVLETAAIAFSSTVLFTVAGDKTAVYHAGRRLKTVNTAGTLYGTVSGSSHSAGTTTVRVVMDNIGDVLDSGLSAVSYGLGSSNVQGTSPPSVGDRKTLVKASLNGTQALTGSSDNKILFDIESADTLGEYDNATNYRWTPRYQSLSTYSQSYLIHSQITLATSITSASIILKKNGSALATALYNVGINAGTISLTFIENGQVASGDYYEIWVNPSGNVNASAGVGTSYLHIVRLT